MKRASLAVALTVMSCLPLAHAESVSEVRSQYEVDYSDLDLSRAQGAVALYHRLQRAAEHVCGSHWTSTRLVARYHRCVRTAMESAVADVNEPLLSSYHQSKTRQYVATASRVSSKAP